jgi:SAM-dependent methyltransferase
MQDEAYLRLAARQEHYWWHCARRRMSVSLLRRYGLRAGCRWVDLGCGPGGNLGLLDEFAPELSVGVDRSMLALDLARQERPNVDFVRADLSYRLPFGDAAFDVVTIFNVLYHDWIENEADTLAELLRILRPGGLAVITEPAFPSLARTMDRLGMGQRRYRIPKFKELCVVAGLEVLLTNYFTSFGALLLLAMKALKHVERRFKNHRASSPSPDTKVLSPSANLMLYAAACIEAFAITRRIPMPIGTTIVCVVRRPYIDGNGQLGERRTS